VPYGCNFKGADLLTLCVVFACVWC